MYFGCLEVSIKSETAAAARNAQLDEQARGSRRSGEDPHDRPKAAYLSLPGANAEPFDVMIPSRRKVLGQIKNQWMSVSVVSFTTRDFRRNPG